VTPTFPRPSLFRELREISRRKPGCRVRRRCAQIAESLDAGNPTLWQRVDPVCSGKFTILT
jgi:hypothetical protein